MSKVAELFPSQEPTPRESRFSEFWELYPHPKRTGKAIARAKFEAITGPGLKTKTLDRDSNTYVDIELRATPDEILNGLAQYAERNKRKGSGAYGYIDDGKYIMNPATFLNRGVWMDYE